MSKVLLVGSGSYWKGGTSVNIPKNPGFHWARLGRGNWFIVQIGGEAPFLTIVDYLPKSVNFTEVKNLKWGGPLEEPFVEAN